MILADGFDVDPPRRRAARADAAGRTAMAITRRKDLTVLVNRYIRPLEALANTSSKDLGL
jgi:hypothetical protein